MKHLFQHLGIAHQLVKHPSVVQRFRRGEITKEDVSRAPWYFRFSHAGKRTLRSTNRSSAGDATRIAKGWLTAERSAPDKFTAALQATSRTGSVTLEELATRWVAADMPDTSGCPRTIRQQHNLDHFLSMALRWWGPRSVGSIRPLHLQEYADYRRQTSRHGTGERSVDLELLALSHLCSWAASRELCEVNPFKDRPRFRKAAHVAHAHEHMPRSTQELHAILGVLLGDSDPTKVVAGAHLAFCALTGLRPGEPGALLRDPTRGRASVPPGAHYPGERYAITNSDGQHSERMAVSRLKSGQNPAVAVHPALADFLDAWMRWCSANIPSASPYWFPHPSKDQALIPFGSSVTNTSLGPWLTQAARSVGAAHVTPHGMRAAYVRVRRSQGAEDPTISNELGQGSGPQLIRNVYGDPKGLCGDGAFAFVPKDSPPAWESLRSAVEHQPANVVAL